MTVYIVSTGSGDDGSEWALLGLFSTLEKAASYKAAYEAPRFRPDGTSYVLYANEVATEDLDPLYESGHGQR